MIESSDSARRLNRNILFLIVVLVALWLGSAFTLVWSTYYDRNRTDAIISRHYQASALSNVLFEEVSILNSAGFDEALASDILFKINVTFRSLKKTSVANSESAESRILNRFHSAMQDYERQGGSVENLMLRADQTHRYYRRAYTAQTKEALEYRTRDQILVVVASLLMVAVALILVRFILGQIGVLNANLLNRTQQIRNAAKLANLGYSRWTANRERCLEASNEYISLLGITEEEFYSRYATLEGFGDLVDPQDFLHFKEEVNAGARELAYRILSKEGTRYFTEVSEPTADNSILVATLDISDLKFAEEQLLQSQKMEVIGQLTGGVAHDFNNILSVLAGALDLVEQGHLDPEQHKLVSMARTATQRGAKLTSQLLAFSRSQPLNPSVLNVAAHLIDMGPLIGRYIGESIEIEIDCQDHVWPCLIDEIQLENAILNLALNAKDAMPDGGLLTIEVENAKLNDEYAEAHSELSPGEYVVVSVTDTGTGMSSEVMDRIFEPFFTTKELGKGTGLGLSMVYGFAKQSGGHLNVYSEPGQGSTFRLYLPMSIKPSDEENVAAKLPVVSEDLAGFSGTILVVEDESDVLDIVGKQLRARGLNLRTATNAREALEVFENEPVDVLLSDLVLPGGMNGKELADLVETTHPLTRIMFMSGYTRNAVVHQGKLDEGVMLLQKPFSADELIRMLVECLAK